MNELNELFEKYNLLLEKSTNYLKDFLNNFPELDLSSDILNQITKDKLKRLEYMIPKLELTNQELSMVKNIFDYYYRNSDLNLSDLIVQDESYNNFVQFIKNIYLKALKYKKDMSIKLETEQKKYHNLINSISKVQELIKSDKEIDVKLLVNYLKELPLTRDSILEITTMVLEKNLRLYQKIKVIQEVESQKVEEKQEIAIDEELDYKTILNIYPKKITDFINKIERDNNYQSEKYETLAKLVVLRDKLMEIKQDYEFAIEDPEYFKNDIPELLEKIGKITMDIDTTLDSYFNTDSEELIEDEMKTIRHLIILNSSLKDLDIFKKGVCSSIISKNLNKLIHTLRYDEVLYGMPIWFIESQTQVMKLKAPRTVGGTPRLFYQLIDKDKAVVLMLGIEGKNNYNYFKQSVESRIKGYEYNQLIKAIKLGSDKPDEISPYNNQMTNKAYLDSMLQYYQNQETEFLNKFATECYSKPENVR